MVKSYNSKISFPLRLHNILDEVDEQGFRDVISWTPDGRAFQVHSQVLFAEVVMPIYFKTDKYKSFQRNLNLWGFRTVRRGYDKGKCSHPLFIRNKRDLLKNMKREQNGSSSGKSKGSNQDSRLVQRQVNASNTNPLSSCTSMIGMTMKPSIVTNVSTTATPAPRGVNLGNLNQSATSSLASSVGTVFQLPALGQLLLPPVSQPNGLQNIGGVQIGPRVSNELNLNPSLLTALGVLALSEGARNAPNTQEMLRRIQEDQLKELQNAVIRQQLNSMLTNQLGNM